MSVFAFEDEGGEEEVFEFSKALGDAAPRPKIKVSTGKGTPNIARRTLIARRLPPSGLASAPVTIHSDHPFLPDPEDRDPLRRFRSRLPVPVTIVTAGTADAMAGLTVSSVLVLEGEPGEVVLLVNPDSDLWEAITDTGGLVVHACQPSHRGMAEVFAGRQPSPGGVFAGRAVTVSRWGPVLTEIPVWLGVSVTSTDSAGWSGLVRGRIEQVEVGGSAEPLVYFRGRYRTLD